MLSEVQGESLPYQGKIIRTWTACCSCGRGTLCTGEKEVNTISAAHGTAFHRMISSYNSPVSLKQLSWILRDSPLSRARILAIPVS